MTNRFRARWLGIVLLGNPCIKRGKLRGRKAHADVEGTDGRPTYSLSASRNGCLLHEFPLAGSQPRRNGEADQRGVGRTPPALTIKPTEQGSMADSKPSTITIPLCIPQHEALALAEMCKRFTYDDAERFANRHDGGRERGAILHLRSCPSAGGSRLFAKVRGGTNASTHTFRPPRN